MKIEKEFYAPKARYFVRAGVIKAVAFDKVFKRQLIWKLGNQRAY